MNKFGMVLGVAAVVTFVGCKDPNYQHAAGPSAQDEAKNVDTTVATTVEPSAGPKETAPAPIAIEQTAPKCTCAPGTKHTSPCQCGDPDCKCIVETQPVATTDLSVPPPAAEYTEYVVQSGDYLAKISKRFNVTINSIKRLNPSIKKDIIRVGQKLKIPGKVDVGALPPPQERPVATPAKSASAKSSAKKASVATAYTGATKEYVVRNGDTLGSIAYGNGINIRQLKSLNGLSSDSLRVGQKLKIPAEKVVSAAKPSAAAAKPTDASAEKKSAEQPVAGQAEAPAKPEAGAEAAAPAEGAAAPEAGAEAKTDASAADADKKADASAAAGETKKAAPATTSYIVQEGDDMTGVSIRWGVSAADIRELNNLGEGDQLVPGQTIKLPADAQQ